MALASLQFLLLALLLPLQLGSASTYYIKPNVTTPCSTTVPCITLSNFSWHSKEYLSSNTTLFFLPGEHHLESDLIVVNISSFTMQSSLDTLEKPTVICTHSEVINLTDITEVYLKSLGFVSCHLLAKYVTHSQLINSTVKDSPSRGLSVSHVSYLAILGCSFENNMDGGLRADNSNLSMSHVKFIGNSATGGGGMLGLDCAVELSGDTLFFNNTAYSNSGGGLFLLNSIAKFNGKSIFAGNVATDLGGGISTFFSTVSMNGTTTFHSNIANNPTLTSMGGGIFGYVSNFTASHEITFVNNFADFGGGISFRKSTIDISGRSNFTSNIAVIRYGGIYLFDGIFTANGSNNIIGNRAINGNGGGIGLLGDVKFSAIGNNTFVGNHAARYGGAIEAQTGAGGTPGQMLVNLSLDGTNVFMDNVADDGGAVNILTGSLETSGNTLFAGNVARKTGGAVRLQAATLTSLDKSTYLKNTAQIGAGIAATFSEVSLQNVVFMGNNLSGIFAIHSTLSFAVSSFVDHVGRSAIRIIDSKINFNESTSFMHNSAEVGGGINAFKAVIAFSGNTNYMNNTATVDGGAIYASSSSITLLGGAILNLVNNSAQEGGGGGLAFALNSHFTLNTPNKVDFSDNSAKFGGAIYVQDNVTSVACSALDVTSKSLNQYGQCFFQQLQIADESQDPDEGQITLLFRNNKASNGSVLYGGLLDRCRFSFLSPLVNNSYEALAVFQSISTFFPAYNDSLIASAAVQACFCDSSHVVLCDKLSQAITVVRGQTFTVSVVAIDQIMHKLSSPVRSRFPTSTGDNARLGDGNDIQYTNGSCTNLYFQVYSPDSSENITLYPDGPCGNQGISSRTITVTLTECPCGFNRSPDNSECVCDGTLIDFDATCDVDENTVTKGDRVNFWIGPTSSVCETYSTTSNLTYNRYCPFDYCQPTARIQLDKLDSQCSSSRTGTLCGGCLDGLSLVFGSSQCKECSNSYLGFLVLYAFAGIALVLFLLVCQMTVAGGTLGGLLFFANIIAVNQTIFFPGQDAGTLVLIMKVFIAWLNLDVGFEVCFYDGMDAYARTWLQFVFPLYIWGLVAAVIVLSRYSQWVSKWLGSNPVAVLATLFLLSYSKLLRTIIASVGVATLDCPGQDVAVWLMDGNIGYFKGKHIPLFLVALLFLVLVFLPYTLLLFFGQWLQRWSNWRIFSWSNNRKIRPFLDAYHAPYKFQHRYWTGLLLLVRCVLFLIFALNTSQSASVNLLATACASSGLLALNTGAGGVYKNWTLQVLESSFILNLTLLSAGTYHVLLSNGNQVALVSTSVGIALLTFIGIVIYRILVRLRDTALGRRVLEIKLMLVNARTPKKDNVEEEGSEDDHQSPVTSSTWVELREPLLEET